MQLLPLIGPQARALVAALGAALVTLGAPSAASAGQASEEFSAWAPMHETWASTHEPRASTRAIEAATPTVANSSALLAPLAREAMMRETPDVSADLAANDDASRAEDDSAPVNGLALDDKVLSRQRGSGLGMMTVAATPQMMQGASSVTLWDEVAPPAPMPVPVDAARAAQSNVVTYTRK